MLKIQHIHQQAYSLLEILLSCALSALILSGLIEYYLAVQKNFLLQEASMSLADTGRFASNFLIQNIRLAGYAGCEEGIWVNQDLAIRGYEQTLPSYLQGKVISGTDSIEIGHCRTDSGKEQFMQDAYIISDTGRQNSLGGKVLALYLVPSTGNKQELVPDITQMKIQYGVASRDGQNIAEYLPAPQVKDWKQVRTVKIFLSLSSEQPVLTQPKPYFFAGLDMPPDRFLHAEWDVYVALRER